MSPSPTDRLAALFEQALELPPSRREAFLADACGSDVGLRTELMALLDAHGQADAYFDGLAESVVAPTLSAIADAEALEWLRAQLADSYHIDRELGGGGMSRVFLAQDLKLRRRVVIKVPPPRRMAPGTAESFRREIEVSARLQHAHIVPLLAADAVDGTWYYTMPFVEGESLKDRLARERPLRVEAALEIWRDVLDALAHAHASGVIHRDVKPANILLSGRNALVTDFGIARAIETAAADSDDPLAGCRMGTPAYMAPEQASGDDGTDARIDVYQAGLVMYEMLSGRLPFDGATTQEILDARLTRDPLPLGTNGVPAELARLVMRCLQRSPAQRPASVDEILGALETSSAPAGAPPRERRAAHGWLLGLTGTAAAIILLALTLTSGAHAPTPPQRPATDIAAHEWYERGMDPALLRSADGTLDEIGYFEHAIEIDSLYAAAWAGIARASVQAWNRSVNDQRQAWMDRAEAAALRATALDPSDPDAQAALGWVRLAQTDYPAAERALRQALAADPAVARGHEGMARVYMMTGRPQAELEEARLGVDADPFSYSAFRELALALAMNGRCEESLPRLDEMKRLTPPAAVAGTLAGMCYASLGQWNEAIAEFEWAAGIDATFAPAFMAYSLARVGRRAEAESILSDLMDGVSESHGAFGIATIYAGLEEYDQAFAWLHRAVDEGSVNSYIMHPIFADLQRDPRFGAIERRMGIALDTQ